jgi:ribosomal protein S18 acetylase RimI-like enzyme
MALKRTIKKSIDSINIVSHDLYLGKERIGWIQHWWKNNSNPGRISGLNIKEKYRRQGHGQFLINYFANEVFKMNGNLLEVTSSPSAESFYEACGFKKTNGWFHRKINGIDYGVTHYLKLY